MYAYCTAVLDCCLEPVGTINGPAHDANAIAVCRVHKVEVELNNYHVWPIPAGNE